MKRLSIVLADPQEQFLKQLIPMFAEAFPGQSELEAFSEKDLFESYAAEPHQADLFLIAEEFCFPSVGKNLTGERFLLTSESRPDAPRMLCRFDGAVQILRAVRALCPLLMDPGAPNAQKKTAAVTFFSASGGTGKTTAALGTAAALAALGKRVLYLNAEPLQTCGYRLRDRALPAEPKLICRLSEPGYDPWMLLKPFVRHRSFDYLPPFEAPLAAFDYSMALWKRILLSAAASGEYDLILADTDPRYDREKAELLACSDRIVFVTAENGAALFAEDRLLSYMNPEDRKKFIRMLNHVSGGSGEAEAESAEIVGKTESPEKAEKAEEAEKAEKFAENGSAGKAAVCMPFLAGAEALSPEELSCAAGFRKLAFLLLSS